MRSAVSARSGGYGGFSAVLRYRRMELVGVLLDEHGGDLCAAGDLKLLKDIGQIAFDGLVAQAEGCGNFLVGLT